MKRFEYTQAVAAQGQEDQCLAHHGNDGWELATMVQIGIADEHAKLNGSGRLIGVKQEVIPGWLMIFKRELNDPNPCQCDKLTLAGSGVPEARGSSRSGETGE